VTSLDSAKSFRDQFDFDSVDYLNFVLALEKLLEFVSVEIECPQQPNLDGCIAYLTAKLRA